MRIHAIFQQKLQEIQGRVPISIMNRSTVPSSEDGFSRIFQETITQSNTSTISHTSQDKPNGDLVAYAKSYLNVPYVWSGTTPKGFDCSGFTQYVMKTYGVDIRRVSQDQAKDGTYVPKDRLSVGDLVFFDTKSNGISHVGIYIGDGNFIHASSAAKKVTISSLEEGFYSDTYVTGRSVLPK